MKYRIDVIKKLLNTIYDSDLPFVSNLALFAVVKDYYPENAEECFAAYAETLFEMGLISSNNSFGIVRYMNGVGFVCSQIRLTHEGQRFIESINDDVIGSKLFAGAKYLSKVLLEATVNKIVTGI